MENPNLSLGRTDHFLGKRTRPNASEKEEVEDTAKCLMLLSRGKSRDPPLIIDGQDYQTVDRGSNKLYRCKTCDKVFASFQALGGHRASHRKPGKAALILTDCRNPNPNPRKGHVQGIGIKPATKKVHECSICGSGFGSGQALGGHMRRHRPVNADVAISGESYKKARSGNYLLELDLNLPAPEDSDSGDYLSRGFGFALSGATPLVGCRY